MKMRVILHVLRRRRGSFAQRGWQGDRVSCGSLRSGLSARAEQVSQTDSGLFEHVNVSCTKLCKGPVIISSWIKGRVIKGIHYPKMKIPSEMICVVQQPVGFPGACTKNQNRPIARNGAGRFENLHGLYEMHRAWVKLQHEHARRTEHNMPTPSFGKQHGQTQAGACSTHCYVGMPQ